MMSRRTIYSCDKCDQEMPEPKSGRPKVAVIVPSADIMVVDLCDRCLAKVFSTFPTSVLQKIGFVK
jgi:hypothetical protein